MDQDRLVPLSLISIEHAVARSTPFDEMLGKWASMKTRRVQIELCVLPLYLKSLGEETLNFAGYQFSFNVAYNTAELKILLRYSVLLVAVFIAAFMGFLISLLLDCNIVLRIETKPVTNNFNY